jgi:hypothetical protein
MHRRQEPRHLVKYVNLPTKKEGSGGDLYKNMDRTRNEQGAPAEFLYGGSLAAR